MVLSSWKAQITSQYFSWNHKKLKFPQYNQNSHVELSWPKTHILSSCLKARLVEFIKSSNIIKIIKYLELKSRKAEISSKLSKFLVQILEKLKFHQNSKKIQKTSKAQLKFTKSSNFNRIFKSLSCVEFTTS